LDRKKTHGEKKEIRKHMAKGVAYVPSMCQALGSIPSTAKKKKKIAGAFYNAK
jgi:hypothetical protein